jgi:hypothetical protein
MTMTIEEIRAALADGPTRELIHQVEQARAEEKLDRIGYFEEGRVETLLRLIARRYGTSALTPETECTVRAATDRQFSDWIDRFADAQTPATVAEFLAGPPGPERDER